MKEPLRVAAQPSILALQRLRQKEHCRFEANLDNTVSSRLAWATYIARSDFLKISWMWCHMPLVNALLRMKKRNQGFKTRLHY